jgi:hypothetical protein
MSLPPLKPWTITRRTAVSEVVVDPAMAPDLTIVKKLVVDAVCPAGHPIVAPVSVTRAVYQAYQLDGTPGPTLGCGPCVRNYQLPLGEWPADFPPPERRTA